ncbi:hypothetical protein MDOR_38480 [Mycolicibacterium doricum]|uniref:Uncharacterized protein n=1 Tax=Mycolicibacterium doricum TaxID=126673 RepID=A0A7I7VWJ8_9MYCO|nr:hypothetical protein [Mycolicibacterium doricum]MCV7269088.1 hypothetical protein [Mycolicibacterium doricum]BBZ09679.1 hypothetical protein MDOR_38480 [Mycolicibacterium doricum]
MAVSSAVKVVAGSVGGLGVLFSLVGLLASNRWADPTTTWAAMASIATVAAAVVAIWTLIALKEDSAERTRPVMVAQLSPAVLSSTAELIVSNTGQSVAVNVDVKFNPPLPVLEGEDALNLVRRSCRGSTAGRFRRSPRAW